MFDEENISRENIINCFIIGVKIIESLLKCKNVSLGLGHKKVGELFISFHPLFYV